MILSEKHYGLSGQFLTESTYPWEGSLQEYARKNVGFDWTYDSYNQKIIVTRPDRSLYAEISIKSKS
jgi:hypothetical protein